MFDCINGYETKKFWFVSVILCETTKQTKKKLFMRQRWEITIKLIIGWEDLLCRKVNKSQYQDLVYQGVYYSNTKCTFFLILLLKVHCNASNRINRLHQIKRMYIKFKVFRLNVHFFSIS